jgi:competence protein ComFC
MPIISEFLDNITSVFFPKRCIFCNDIIPVSTPACQKCADKLPIIAADTCGHCGFDNKHCKCKANEFVKAVAPFYYDGFAKNALANFKFNGKATFGKYMAEYMTAAILQEYKDIHFDLITCIPLSKTEYNNRGFNQSAVLCEQISKNLKMPCDIKLIKKVREIDPQRTKKAHERKGNVLGAFDIQNPKKIKGLAILLIDDVLTTGATLNETAKMLKIYGAKRVYCTVFAMTKHSSYKFN